MSWDSGRRKKRNPFKQRREQLTEEQDGESQGSPKEIKDMTPEELDQAMYETKLKLWQEEERELRERRMGTYAPQPHMVARQPLQRIFKRNRPYWK